MIDLIVRGMTCGHCERAVAAAIERVAPGALVEIDRGAERVRVDGDADPARLVAAIGEEGYTAEPAP